MRNEATGTTKRAYTTGEVAARLGVAPATVLARIKRGEIDAIRFNVHYRIRAEELDRLLNYCPTCGRWRTQ